MNCHTSVFGSRSIVPTGFRFTDLGYISNFHKRGCCVAALQSDSTIHGVYYLSELLTCFMTVIHYSDLVSTIVRLGPLCRSRHTTKPTYKVHSITMPLTKKLYSHKAKISWHRLAVQRGYRTKFETLSGTSENQRGILHSSITLV